MPWGTNYTERYDCNELIARRISYYIHLRTNRHGGVSRASKELNIARSTLTRYAKFNAESIVYVDIKTLSTLVRYFGDKLDTVMFACVNATSGDVFEAMLHYQVTATQRRDVADAANGTCDTLERRFAN